MNIAQVVYDIDIAIHKLPIWKISRKAKDEAEKMQHTIQLLVNEIRALELKISLLDNIVFSCEQECKRTEQELQEVNAV
jgi:hypothetical protein